MKVVVAPNAFKGSLSAAQAARAMATGVARAAPGVEIAQLGVADGGDGLIEVLREAMDAKTLTRSVSGPLGEPVEATFLYVPGLDLSVIEMASASGLVLLREEQRDPMRTTTLGTGELVRAALDQGVSRIIVGVGGSATNDGGVGMASALGARFTDGAERPVAPVGGALGSIRHIDLSGLDPRLHGVRVEVICDVDNPLLGDQGAARVYGPQKGAGPQQVQALERGLINLAAVIEAGLGLDVRHLPGAGAAGGLGAGLKAFLGAELRRGVDVVLDLVGLEGRLQGADLVLTAEGQIDLQTAHGKAPAGVAQRARARGIPCIAIAGGIGERISELYPIGIDAVFSLCPGPVSLEEAMVRAAAFLTQTSEQVMRVFMAGRAARGG
jgi:glycerate kinase